ncbi:class I SAM-dependent methyltransferase [Paraburkholderia sediminicola]|uniref:class I SAM-dependent methyltransferase n=1 Tax=Paraburkholderia sediminicola TaxID=458836 RepID=UPI0038B74BC0
MVMHISGDRLEPVAGVSVCKVCHGEAPLYGVVDFNKNCEERRGGFLPQSGIPIYYHRCDRCGLIFTRAFDRWQKSAYLKHIYNEHYEVVDPDYVDARATANAVMVADFIAKGNALRCLDYGGGNGTLSGLLRGRDLDAHSWDPMAEDATEPPLGSFDLVTAFEVLEHTPEPLATVEQALGALRQRGVMLFSTMTMDDLPPRAMDHWYIAPRNGHITIHTAPSLQTLFATFGYRVHHFNKNLHLALRETPDWLS